MYISKINTQITTNPNLLKTTKDSSMPVLGLKITPAINQDTVSFQRKPDLLTLPKEKIFQIIQKSITKRNHLGEGADAVVYKITDTEYCFRRPFFSNDYTDKFSLNLTQKDKINHIVANLGSGCTIMKKIEGIPVAKINTKSSEELEYTASLIENFPVKSFYEFLNQITYAHNNGMKFDNHWANVILNPEKQTFTIIDFIDTENFCENDEENIDPLYSMFSSITTLGTSAHQIKTYIKKILLAGLIDFEPDNVPPIHPEEYDFNTFLQWVSDAKYFTIPEEVLENFKSDFNELIQLKIDELNKSSAQDIVQDKLDKIIKKVCKTF